VPVCESRDDEWRGKSFFFMFLMLLRMLAVLWMADAGLCQKIEKVYAKLSSEVGELCRHDDNLMKFLFSLK
jgi:hypothetical protein